jgi:hypothetical protein
MNTSTGFGSASARASATGASLCTTTCHPALRDFGKLVRREETFEQQETARVSAQPQCNRGIELDERKAVGVLQRRQEAHESVSVGIRLYDRQQLRAGGELPRRARFARNAGRLNWACSGRAMGGDFRGRCTVVRDVGRRRSRRADSPRSAIMV